WRHGPRARVGIREAERPSKSQPARQCGFTLARPSKMPSIRQRGLPARSLRHRRNPRCGSETPSRCAGGMPGFVAVLLSSRLLSRASALAGRHAGPRSMAKLLWLTKSRRRTYRAQDAIAQDRSAKAGIAIRLAGPRVGAFWKPSDPALISLPGPAWV